MNIPLISLNRLSLSVFVPLSLLVTVLTTGCSPAQEASTVNDASSQMTLDTLENKADEPKRPNIVLILTDDQGYGDTSGFGQTQYETPNIDSIAENGVMLSHFYVSQPICSTSRASILTGAYANRLGISYALFPTALTDGPAVGLNPDEETLPELLKEQGYATGLFGKWHLGDVSPFLPTEHGFDTYYGIPYSNDMWSGNVNKNYDFGPLPVFDQDQIVETLTDDQSNLTKNITERSVAFIEKNAASPFFLMLAHPQPHVPLFVSKEFEGKSGAGLYGDVIMEIDWSTGQLIDALKRKGVYENTLVIYMSDNGPWLTYGNHAGSSGELRNGKQSTFEGGVRTPAHIQWPAGLAKQDIVSTPMMTIDLLPTLAKLTGARLPEKEIDGKDIWPIISGKQSEPAHEAYFFYFHHNDLSAVRYKQWKLYYPHRYNLVEQIGNNGNKGKSGFVMLDAIKLYDLDNDPSETVDLSAERPDIVAEIEALADIKRAELGDDLRGIKGRENRPMGSL
ncbi:sulfatase [Glaciecola siphonariae]|uniref:Sulfatase n=1 Tax=Glaciecola siphonariae TaxID=521012 RepID=A0ABV9LZN0_9ALTE